MIANVKNGSSLPDHPQFHNIQGQTALIAGGASAQGSAVARVLLERGARVVLLSADAAALARTLEDLRPLGGDLRGLLLDAALSPAAAAQQVFDAVGGLDILVNITAAMPCFAGEDAEASQNRLTQAAIAPMHARGHGHIIHAQFEDAPPTAQGRSLAAALRRQAAEAGLSMTTITPAAQDTPRRPSASIEAADIARSVLNSLVQPFRIDVVFVQGAFTPQMM